MGGRVEVTTDTSTLKRLIAASNGAPVVKVLHDGKEYGVYQEFGTSRGVPPHPFMTPALEQARGWMDKALGPVLEQGADLDTAIGKIAFDAEAVAKANAPWRTGDLRASIKVTDGDKFRG